MFSLAAKACDESSGHRTLTTMTMGVAVVACLCSRDHGRDRRNDHVYLRTDELGSKVWEAVFLPVGPSRLDSDGLAFHITKLAQPLPQCIRWAKSAKKRFVSGGPGVQIPPPAPTRTSAKHLCGSSTRRTLSERTPPRASRERASYAACELPHPAARGVRSARSSLPPNACGRAAAPRQQQCSTMRLISAPLPTIVTLKRSLQARSTSSCRSRSQPRNRREVPQDSSSNPSKRPWQS